MQRTQKVDDSSMDSASQILEIAERRMRLAGYNAVSYRDIAAEMGIKSASLHYHFPKKEDLGAALVQRYTAAFKKGLADRTERQADPKKRITAFVNRYRQALEDQGLVCLCAVLGAEASGLPASVTNEVKAFFETNIAWLAAQYKEMNVPNTSDRAKTTLALLEGAMIISVVNDDMSIFDAATSLILVECE